MARCMHSRGVCVVGRENPTGMLFLLNLNFIFHSILVLLHYVDYLVLLGQFVLY